jgi:hypothetical protein
VFLQGNILPIPKAPPNTLAKLPKPVATAIKKESLLVYEALYLNIDSYPYLHSLQMLEGQ